LVFKKNCGEAIEGFKDGGFVVHIFPSSHFPRKLAPGELSSWNKIASKNLDVKENDYPPGN